MEELRSHGSSQADAFLVSLRTCIRNKDLARGIYEHADLVQMGLLETCSRGLVLMYVACGELGRAKELLHTHKSSSNVVTWTALISAYAREGRGQDALDCFEQMRLHGILPDAVTYTCILKACAMVGAADKGKQVHDEVARQGLLQNSTVVGNGVVDMYAKCGDLSKARQVLDGLASRDVVSWNALIAGYVQGGYGEQALSCYEEMQREDIIPSAVTYACILKACAMAGAGDKGKQVHDKIASQGLLQNDIVLGNALVDMYAKCGALLNSRQVLDGLPSRDVISWNALIAGYIHHGHAEQALSCFDEMQRHSFFPSAVTYICILKACAMLGAADKGRQIHERIAKEGLLQNDIMLGNALVDMYAKCGALSKARAVLEGLSSRDVVSWNALIAGYTKKGLTEQALNCFIEMQREGIVPDAVTCVCVLNACNHRGLLEEGQEIFANMGIRYGVSPTLECYHSMVDMFGRAGHLEKAVKLIQDVPATNYSIIWHTLLGACQKWSDVKVGRWAFEQAVKQDKTDEAAYVLMADIYAVAGLCQEAEDIKAMRTRNKAGKKKLGASVWMDSLNGSDAFPVGDTTHAQSKSSDVKFEDTACKMLQQGYFTGMPFFAPTNSHALLGKAYALLPFPTVGSSLPSSMQIK